MPATARQMRDRRAPQHQGSAAPTFHGLPAYHRNQQIKANPYKWLRSLLGMDDRCNDQEMIRAAAEEIAKLRGEPTSVPGRTDARLGADAESETKAAPRKAKPKGK